jgi:PmbA protein
VKLIEDILRAAKQVADEAEVFYAHSESIAADLKRDSIAIGSKSKGSGIIIRIIKDGKIGISCTDNPKTWKNCLEAACASARFSDPLHWKGLPGPEKIDQKPLAFDKRITTEPALVIDLING